MGLFEGSMRFYGILWGSIGLYGSPVGLFRVLWGSMGFYEVLWGSVGLYGGSMGFCGAL